MTTHRLAASQIIGRPIDEVFGFFARPGNLARITPPALGFEQVSTDLDMRAGLEIDHRIPPIDIGPLLRRMPRRLTSLDEGLATYLAPGSGPAEIASRGESEEAGQPPADRNRAGGRRPAATRVGRVTSR